MHTLEEFEDVTNEIVKNPQDLTDITRETVELVEKSLNKDEARAKEDQELEL